MNRIKIVSNPYLKETVFEIWDEAAKQWNGINRDNHPGSGLIGDKLRTGFFPFEMTRILDMIIEEFYIAPDKVEIEFKGTEDEYNEFELICNGSAYSGKTALVKSTEYLENARDILPDIVQLFKKLRPLVTESIVHNEKIEKELNKFVDASDDVIPICVIGNYSTGKSTFINALIGYELLPSSDEPTTSKLYKISQSKHKDRAKVDFEYNNKSISIRLTPGSYKFLTDPEDNEVSIELKMLLKEIAEQPIHTKLTRVLNVISAYSNKHDYNEISDLVELETPFNDNELWGKIRSNFIIFDTPGSNSATNIKHYKVLQKAMEDLSNGMPVFISEYDTLDSTDNEKLYQDINNMEELDNRFTMIIVNKADAASLKKNDYNEKDRQKMLDLAIPKKLYSSGIYFVSSIIGMGAKNNGVFSCEHSAEIFADQKDKYNNPKSKFYKKLYRYNILPEQIKQKYDACSDEHANLLYANSGLYCVEQAIETFANVYSHYNKCQQSQLFLTKLIHIASDAINDAKQKREEYRKHIHANLEKDKGLLLASLEKRCGELETQFHNEYDDYMIKHIGAPKEAFSSAQLKLKEEAVMTKVKNEKELNVKKYEVSDSLTAIKDNAIENIANALKERNFASLRKLGSNISSDFKNIMEHTGEFMKTRNVVASESSNELLAYIRESFTKQDAKVQRLIENNSKKFWQERTEIIKSELNVIITITDALNEEKRDDVSDIIIKYERIGLDSDTTEIFNKTDFLRRVIGERLDLNKLHRRYGDAINGRIDEIYNSCKASHTESFSKWLSNLLSQITENSIEYNPALRSQAEIMNEETARITELESRIVKLNEYKTQVINMMGWSNA